MTAIGDILRAHGIVTKSFLAYGEPLSGNPAPFATLQDAVNYYASLGFLIYPWQDGSNGYDADLANQVVAWGSVGGKVVGPLYGWGYVTQFYNLGRGYVGTLYPNEQEFYLSSGVLSPAMSYGYKGIVMDAPELLGEWQYEYSQIDSKVGLANILGISGWPASDHPVNYAGAGADGGHNMNTYVRYVNSPLRLYYNDVITGTHRLDGTPCLLWGLVGSSANYTAANCEPTIAMATDISTYHKRGGHASSFVTYYVAACAQLEWSLLQMVMTKGRAFRRTAIPANYLALVPAYDAAPAETFGDGVDIQTSGGMVNGASYFNWANPDDNSSNPGGGYGVASASTVLSFFLESVPYVSHNAFLDIDTDPSSVQSQAAATAWPHFGALWNKLPVDGWFGYEQDAIRLLTIDHNYGEMDNYSAFGLVCHQWGADSYASLAAWNLSQFKVIFGFPTEGQDANYAADVAAIKAAVQGGTNLIFYGPPKISPPVDLSGIGTTATPIPYPHPILAPYAQADLDAVYSGTYGWINQYGNGKVVTLPNFYYGEGFGIPNANQGGDGLASGLGYLTLNAIQWLGGQKPPAVYLPRFVQRTSWAAPLAANGEGQKSGIGLHAVGKSTPIIFLSNARTAPVPVNFLLGGSFYGYPSSYSFRDVNTGILLSGSGDIDVNLAIPAQDWMLFFSQFGPTPTTLELTAKQV